MSNVLKILLVSATMIPILVLFSLLWAFVFGVIVMLLWNYAVSPLFHGPELSYLQAVALLFLLSILGNAAKGTEAKVSS